MTYNIYVLVQKGHNIHAYTINATDCQSQLGNDLLQLIIGHDCNVAVSNGSTGMVAPTVVEQEDFYELAVNNARLAKHEVLKKFNNFAKANQNLLETLIKLEDKK